MRIKSLQITSHGPLKNKTYQFKPGLNLIYGPNERGKSLTFDALIKLLLGKKSKDFEGVNRVETDPGKLGGFIEILKDKQTHQLQGQADIAQLLDLEPEDCKNLFFIRNSNLSIGQEFADQQQFYTNFTDRLTGLKTQQINAIKSNLRDIAQITYKTASFQNTAESEKLADRIELARALLEEESQLSKVLDSTQSSDWQELETTLFNNQSELEQIEQKLIKLEQARQAQEKKKLQSSLDQLKNLQEKLNDLEKVKQSQLDEWRQSEFEIKTIEEQVKEVQSRIKTEQQKLDTAQKELEKTQEKLAKLSQTYQELETRTSPKLIQLQNQLAETRSQKNNFWSLAGLLGGSLLLILSLVAYMMHPTNLILGLTTVLLAPTLISGYHYWQTIRSSQKIQAQLEQLKLELIQHDIEGNKLENLLQQVQAVKQEYKSLEVKKVGLVQETKALKNDIDQLKDTKLSKLKGQLNKAEQEISKIKAEAQVQEKAELKQKLDQKQDLNQQTNQHQTRLEDKLGSMGHSGSGFSRFSQTSPLQQKIRYWESKLAQQTLAVKTDAQLEFNQQEFNQLQQEKQKLSQQLKENEQKAARLRQVMSDLERQISQALNHHLACQSLADLRQAKHDLKQFIQHHQQKKQAALTAVDILNQIQQQDKQKIEALFGQDSLISQYFAQITNQRYSQAFLDLDQNQVKVEKNDGQIFKASQLSAGTYDQLYFAIRLGLAEKLMPDEPGFFVMDDPFLKSDAVRLEKQLKMLEDLAKKDWQIIYLSAKKEVRDYFNADSNQVNLIDLS